MRAFTPESFWQKVEKTEDCWIWKACTLTTGYGVVRRNGRRQVAHRTAYELLVGEIPAGMELDHTCHNRACVNPEHLRPTTRKQNMENRSGPTAINTSGLLGVHWDKVARKWLAQVRHDGRRYYCGRFKSLEDAGAAVKAKRIELYTHNDIDRNAA